MLLKIALDFIFTLQETSAKQRYETDNTYNLIEVISETLNLDSITICGLFNDFLIETPVYISRNSLGNNTMDIVKRFNTKRTFIDYQL